MPSQRVLTAHRLSDVKPLKFTIMLIYTDEDIRLDLLLKAERDLFPERLSQKDRRDILFRTRDRADSVDLDGHIILSADSFMEAYRRHVNSGTSTESSPQLRATITRDVVIPSTGVVESVDAGLSDVVQRLLDRGIAVNFGLSCSGMVTDHPGMRWLHDAADSRAHTRFTPGQHVYGTGSFVATELVFPVRPNRRDSNSPRMADALKAAACESGFLVDDRGTALHMTLPCCMDGTGLAQLQTETAALSVDGAEPDALYRQAERHGGVALYSDTMLQDRLMRFSRAVERKLIADRSLAPSLSADSAGYADYLTATQLGDIHSGLRYRTRALWTQRMAPYLYDYYREPASRVDEVARMAGYPDYREYMTRRFDRLADSARRSTFQKLERQYLHADEAGKVKLFRISSGISRAADDWLREQSRKVAEPVIAHYRDCGYPVDRLHGVSLVTAADDTAVAYAYVGDRLLSRPVRDCDLDRLNADACTPFEVALTAFAKDLGWASRLNIDVPLDTVRQLDLVARDGSGRMPLTHDGHVYMVSADLWQHAWLLARFQQLPAALQRQLLDIHPPLRSVVGLTLDALSKRFDTLDAKLVERIPRITVTPHPGGLHNFGCLVDGQGQHLTFTAEELKLRGRLLPDVTAEAVYRQAIADRLGLDLMASQGHSRGRGR